MISNYRFITLSILWIARAWGSIILAFVLFFLMAHMLGDESGSGLTNPKEMISFICFPVGTIIGLALAYKWEGLGGWVSSIGIVLAMILNEGIDLKFLLTIFPPGFLYIVYWFRSRRDDQDPGRMNLH